MAPNLNFRRWSPRVTYDLVCTVGVCGACNLEGSGHGRRRPKWAKLRLLGTAEGGGNPAMPEVSLSLSSIAWHMGDGPHNFNY